MIQGYKSRNFCIFSVSELEHIDFAQVLETSVDTVRRSIDGTKTFVKWEGATPECIVNLTTQEGLYGYEEFLLILATPEWTSNEHLL